MMSSLKVGSLSHFETLQPLPVKHSISLLSIYLQRSL